MQSRFGDMIDADNAGIAQLDQSPDLLKTRADDRPLPLRYQDAIVGNQPPGASHKLGLGETGECQGRLAASGWPQEQEADAINGYGGCVNVFRRFIHGGTPTGRDRMNRAPMMRPVAGSITFSALNVPA